MAAIRNTSGWRICQEEAVLVTNSENKALSVPLWRTLGSIWQCDGAYILPKPVLNPKLPDELSKISLYTMRERDSK
jgi:hypothetical protein